MAAWDAVVYARLARACDSDTAHEEFNRLDGGSSTRLVERSTHEVEVGAEGMQVARRLNDHRRVGVANHLLERLQWDLAGADVRVPVGPGPGRVAGVVRVEEVDAA